MPLICIRLIKKDGGTGPMMSWQPWVQGAKSHSNNGERWAKFIKFPESFLLGLINYEA